MGARTENHPVGGDTQDTNMNILHCPPRPIPWRTFTVLDPCLHQDPSLHQATKVSGHQGLPPWGKDPVPITIKCHPSVTFQPEA